MRGDVRERRPLKRIWTVRDFAAHTGISSGRAKRMLKALDAKHRGQLLLRSNGTNREYTFIVATLARLEPDMIQRATTEELEARLDELEEQRDEIKAAHERIARVVGEHTRGIEGLREAARRPLKRVA